MYFMMLSALSGINKNERNRIFFLLGRGTMEWITRGFDHLSRASQLAKGRIILDIIVSLDISKRSCALVNRISGDNLLLGFLREPVSHKKKNTKRAISVLSLVILVAFPNGYIATTERA
jgi:acetoacetate decarboxylase